MFYRMIADKRDMWLASPDCTVQETVRYIRDMGQMRDAQIEAIETYLFLKIAGDNRPLHELFSSGFFNSLDIGELALPDSVKRYFWQNPAAAALYEYASQTNESGQPISAKLLAQITKAPESIDYVKFFYDAFYQVTYSDYLFSLPMGAGKTYLMAAFIYLDLYFALNEPKNPAFAHNFIIFAPSGLKSSVVPSLRTIQNFDPSWVLPEPAASEIRRMISFEVLDQGKTAKKSNKTKNPNVQKISSHQPLSELFGLIAVTNAEKVIYELLEKEDLQLSWFKKEEQEKIRQASELRSIIGEISHLAVFIDEVHHASAAGDSKLRKVVTKWTANRTFNSVIGFSGTPYLEKPEKVEVVKGLTVATAEITNSVYYYPLVGGIGNFLKKPVVKVAEIADSTRIIENGVREFLDQYKDTVYSDGATAKLGIYCGTIEKLETLVFPLVSGIAAEYGLGGDTILRFHRGNKEYPMPADSQMQFEILDKPISKIRIVLLVQIGKEGWDCRSLTGIILSQEGDCPKNMVLQTSCRCLRQVVKGQPETALIYLNDSNAAKLNDQLQQQHHITLQEFAAADHSKTTLHRYDRTAHLKLPKIDFYQLMIRYTETEAEELAPERDIPLAAEGAGRKTDIIREADFVTMRDVEITVVDEERGTKHATFGAWLYGIVRGSFGTLTMTELKPYSAELKAVFDAITYEKGGSRYYSSRFDRAQVEANIRKAFVQKRSYITREEVIPAEASLLNIANFTPLVYTEKPDDYYPDQKTVENIVLEDKGKRKVDKNTQKMIDLARETGQEKILEMLLRETASHPQKDRSFHYLPYHTDSGFEREFLDQVLAFPQLEELGLEVYYNGERAMTEFRIKCYKTHDGKWQYIGMYTPDFLILQRKDGKIYRAIIVETKGEGFAENFRDRRSFMQNEFCRLNNEAFGYRRFDFLYLEDTLSDRERITTTHERIRNFFE